MNPTYHKFAALALMLSLLVSPATSFAKNKENGKNNENKSAKHAERDNDNDDDDRDERRMPIENKLNKSEKRLCLRAFGHFIAPGHIKNKGEVELLADCFLPFGIKKKFGGSASTTDSVAPAISNLSVRPNSVRAQISWNTNEKSDSAVFFSILPNVDLNSSSTRRLMKNESVKEHSLTLESLSASTTYYFLVRSRDASMNTSTSSISSFLTKPLPTDAVLPVISTIAYLPATSTIAVSWKTNENATSRIYFSTSTPLDLTASTTGSVFSGILTENHLLTATGLTASTTYYFAIESVDQSGNKTTTPSFSLMTR